MPPKVTRTEYYYGADPSAYLVTVSYVGLPPPDAGARVLSAEVHYNEVPSRELLHERRDLRGWLGKQRFTIIRLINWCGPDGDLIPPDRSSAHWRAVVHEGVTSDELVTALTDATERWVRSYRPG